MNESWTSVFHEWSSKPSKCPRFRAEAESRRVQPDRFLMFLCQRCRNSWWKRRRSVSRDRIQHRTVERIVDVPVPEVEEELVEASKVFSQDRDQQRSAEETVETPVISLAEKVVEVPVIQTRGEDATGCEHSYPTRCRHSRSGESHHSGRDQTR